MIVSSNTQESASVECESDGAQVTSLSLPVHKFLNQSGQIAKAIMKDGNCLYRAVAFHTLGNEDEHDAIRMLLVRFENLNKGLFEGRFIPYDEISTRKASVKVTTFHDHLKHQLHPGTWGTHVELMASATLFQVPVYCCYTNGNGTSYHWECTNPIATTTNFKIPEIVEEDPAFNIQIPHYIELLYWERTHF